MNKLVRKRRISRRRNKGQATTELAILGAVVLMLLGYLLQQGFVYSNRQALEMYSYRKALQLSRSQQRGITLTVIRDLIAPSFFTGLNRQRIMATSSLEHNPWMLYNPEEGTPQDIPTRQLIQMGDAMIRKGYMLEVPPTKMKVLTKDNEGEGAEWTWASSAISEIDPQTKDVKGTTRTSDYSSTAIVREDAQGKRFNKELRTYDVVPTAIEFDKAEDIKKSYKMEDWEENLIYDAEGNPRVEIEEIPQDIEIILDETIERTKDVTTKH